MSRDLVLESCFLDGITQVQFGSGICKSLLAVSSWDAHLRVFEPQSGSKSLVRECNLETAVLACSWGAPESSTLYGSTYDGFIFATDALNVSESSDTELIGRHEGGIRCLNYHNERQLLFSGSFDSSVKCWDTRTAGRQTPVETLQQPGKVFAMDVLNDQLIVGTAGRHILIYDIRNLKTPTAQRTSSLGFQTRSIKLFPDGSGYAVACVEGRVAMETIDNRRKSVFAFKCHRKETEGTSLAFPVNCIAFHPVHGTFVTGGCDNIVNVWDPINKKRLKQYPAYPTSIASVDFNHDGTLLAIASSYTFEQGEKDAPPDEVYIRLVNEIDFKPRAAAPSSRKTAARS